MIIIGNIFSPGFADMRDFSENESLLKLKNIYDTIFFPGQIHFRYKVDILNVDSKLNICSYDLFNAMYLAFTFIDKKLRVFSKLRTPDSQNSGIQ